MAELAIKLTFTNLPSNPTTRVFKDRAPLHELRTSQDLTNRIDQKLSFMDLPRSRYFVFYKEADGDRVVVDETYFQLLLKDNIDGALLSAALDPLDSCTPVSQVNKQLFSFAFEIDVDQSAQASSCQMPDPSFSTLPAARLSKESLDDASQGILYRVDDLKAPPAQNVVWRLAGVVVAVSSKTTDICEVELADEMSKNRITLVSFSHAVSSKLLEKLKGNGTQVVAISHITCVWKTDKDKKFQTNGNPLRLTCTQATHVQVINVHPVPRPEFSVPIAVVSDNGATRGLFTFGTSGSAPVGPNQRLVNPIISSASKINVSGSVDTSSSSARVSSQSSCKRTPFLPTGAPTAQSAAPSAAQTSTVATRAQMLDLQEARRDDLKTRIMLSGPPCPKCIICDVDATDPASLEQVASMLRLSRQNGGRNIPTQAVLYHSLCDNRNFVKSDAPSPARHICRRTVPDVKARRHYVVHPRCAHIADDYQQRVTELEDIRYQASLNFCFMCNRPGAVVRCYHPDCDEIYHVICALFSGGYVNFGQDDPFRPVPACPKHAYVPVKSAKRRRTEMSLLSDPADAHNKGIAFDATQVLAEDLRDPDDDAESGAD